jgi:Nitroreductase
MDIFDAIKSRRSIRAYMNREVEEEKLKKVLDAARLAPSAVNRQEWKFIAVRDKETRKKLGVAAGGQKFVGTAPVVIVACATESGRVMACGQSAYTVDLSIATAYMTLEAYEQGLGTCWIGSFFEDQIKDILNIPGNVRIVAVTPLGYPAERPEPRPRKSFDEVVCWEKYK